MYTVTPDVFSATPSYFNGGADFPAGSYAVSYVNGAFGWSGPTHWTVNLQAGSQFYLTNGSASVAWSPGLFGTYPDQASAQAAFAGMTFRYAHPGGPMGMYLVDSPYSDNVAGSPSPTFGIPSPSPAIPIPSLTATPSLPGNVPSIILSGT